jgi:hypothetical protein
MALAEKEDKKRTNGVPKTRSRNAECGDPTHIPTYSSAGVNNL